MAAAVMMAAGGAGRRAGPPVPRAGLLALAALRCLGTGRAHAATPVDGGMFRLPRLGASGLLAIGAPSFGQRTRGPHAPPGAPTFLHREGGREAAHMESPRSAPADWRPLHQALTAFAPAELREAAQVAAQHVRAAGGPRPVEQQIVERMDDCGCVGPRGAGALQRAEAEEWQALAAMQHHVLALLSDGCLEVRGQGRNDLGVWFLLPATAWSASAVKPDWSAGTIRERGGQRRVWTNCQVRERPAEQAEAPSVPQRKSRYYDDDMPLIAEMTKLIKEGVPPFTAAGQLAPRAEGPTGDDSKVRRLVGRWKLKNPECATKLGLKITKLSRTPGTQ